MPLSPGARLGPYEIVGRLGAGGMGEVYRGQDSKLNRAVAIKVLPDLFASDPERLARFTREAQTLAALNHPHIAQIYGLESHSTPSTGSGQATSGPASALVMELVDGEDLSSIVARGPLPLGEALPIARQIADALEAAHEQGIVHRDLKPANVKVRPDGTVKVLDFGLAKALASEAAGSAANVVNSPTFSLHATQMGVILGTAAYMAPEQARGRPVDRRADIWAFGCVLYELVTGRRAFDGEEITDVLARLIERDPDWSVLPAGTPPEIRRLLGRCLTKDPKARLRDIGEARLAIDEVLAGASGAVATGPPSQPGLRAGWQRILPWALAIVFALIALILFVRVPARPDTRPLHVEVDLPPDVEYFSGPSLSADGTRLALVGVRVGARQVYMRSLDDTEMRPVAVLAAETGGDIYTTPVDGGEVKPLLVTKAYEGGAQVSPDGRWMTYISNESGRMEVFLRPFGAADRRWPVSTDGGLHALWSPDGRQIFYRSGQQLLVVDVTTTPEVRLSAPRLLFDRRYAFGQNLTIPNYSLSGDGREFLMVQEEAGGRHMNLVLNWLQGLERRPDIK